MNYVESMMYVCIYIYIYTYLHLYIYIYIWEAVRREAADLGGEDPAVVEGLAQSKRYNT